MTCRDWSWFHCWTLLLEAFVVRQQRDRVFSMCDGGGLYIAFGVGPFSNHHHSSLDMSKTWGPCGELQRWVIAFHVALKHDVLTKEVHYHLAVVSRVPATPSGVSNIVKTQTIAPQWFIRQYYGLFFLQTSVTYCAFHEGEKECCGSGALSE